MEFWNLQTKRFIVKFCTMSHQTSLNLKARKLQDHRCYTTEVTIYFFWLAHAKMENVEI